MSFERLRRAPKTIGFRLAVWSSLFFVLSTSIVFGLAYLLLSSSLQQRDRDSLRLELHEVAVQYRSGGVSALAQDLPLQERLGTPQPFMVRVVGPGDGARFVKAPRQWVGFDLSRLDTAAGNREWISLPAKRDDKVLEVGSLRMPDGAVLQVGKITEDREEILERFRTTVAGVVIPVLALGLSGGVVLAFWALRPIRQIIHTVRAIETGAMDTRVPIRWTGDELDELSLLFNSMLDRIATLIAAMRGALDNVAHDLRTPVTRIRIAAELALQSEQGPEVSRQALAECVEESDHILTMLNTFMDIAEADTGALRLRLDRLNISALVRDTIEIYSHAAEEKGISMSVTAPPQLWLTADRSRLRQVVANLLDNAIKYTPSGGRVELQVLQQEGSFLITVKDTGIGMRPDELPRIWDRLYRGDESGSERGLGLGLSLVRAIVQAHRGRVDVSSAIGVGSTFTVVIPQPLEQ